MSLSRANSYAITCLALAGMIALAGVGAGLLPATAGASSSAPLAHAASNPPLVSINEWGRLQKQSSKGYTIDEKGIGWGSFNCSVLIEMTLSGTLVTSRYTAYLQGGSIDGTATAHIHRASTEYGYFSGTITLDHGTGSRSGASGTASFAGTINRTSYAMNTHITGKLRL